MVYDTQITIVNGVYKPTNITGRMGPLQIAWSVGFFLWLKKYGNYGFMVDISRTS